MTRSFLLAPLALLAVVTILGSEGTDVPPHAVTFNKDILPILQANCQGCHRPGGIAPMSLLTYEDARPWAKAIKAAVITRKMPPWFADKNYGEFRNAPPLTPANVNTLVAWADRGAYEGNPADKPAPVPQPKQGWRIQPDVVVSMPQPHRVAAKGVGEIKEFIIPSPFKQDTWVSAIEIRPGDPSVVHHVILQVPEQTQTASLLALLNNDCPPNLLTGPTFGGYGGGGSAVADPRANEKQTGLGEFMTMEAVYAPGAPPLDFRYTDAAKLIPGGKPLRLEVHYTPNGAVATDKTSVAFTIAKTPAQRRFVVMAPQHMADSRKPIPAGKPNWETRGELTFTSDVDLVWFMPHMHLRGKDMTFDLIYPDGRDDRVFSGAFNFHWQIGYQSAQPIRVPKGTRMIITAHHDNSSNNSNNPAPDKPVKWGEMTTEEMMLPWFGVLADRDATPTSIARYKPGDLDGPFPGAILPGLPSGIPAGLDSILRPILRK